MTDLSTQLRSYFDEIDPPFEVADLMTDRPPAVHAEGPLRGLLPRRHRRWARAAIAATTGAVVVLAAVGGVAWLLRGDDPRSTVASLELLGVDDIPAFRATVEHSNVEGRTVYLASYEGPGGGMRWETSQQLPVDPNTGEPFESPVPGYLSSVWDGGTSAAYVVRREDRDFFERLEFESRDEALSAAVGPGDLTWQTGRWGARCRGGDTDPLRGEHTVVGATEIAGRVVTQIECRTLRDVWMLWVDTETGLLLRIEGRASVFFEGSGPDGLLEITALEFDPDFPAGLFDVTLPSGAVDVSDFDFEGTDPSGIIEDAVVGMQPFYLRAQYTEGTTTRTLDVWWQSKDRWRVETVDGDAAGSYAVAGEPGIGGDYDAANDTWDLDPFAGVAGVPGLAIPIVDTTPVPDGFAPRFEEAAAAIATTGLRDLGCEQLPDGTVRGRDVERWSCADGELSIDMATGLVIAWTYGALVAGEDVTATYEVLALDTDPVFDSSLFIFEPRGQEKSELPDPLLGLVAPEMRGELLRGGSFDLADLRGEQVVLLIWASWCPPCMDDLGDFDVVAGARSDLTFVTVLLQDEPAAAADAVASGGYSVPVVAVPDNGPAFWQDTWPVEGVPTTVFIDADGTIVEVHAGLLGFDGLRDTLERLDW